MRLLVIFPLPRFLFRQSKAYSTLSACYNGASELHRRTILCLQFSRNGWQRQLRVRCQLQSLVM